MSEKALLQQWNNAWNRLIIAQLAPTALLITTVALLQFGLADARASVRWAAVLILLASGILGALAEFTAARDGMNIAEALDKLKGKSPIAHGVIRTARWLPVVKFVTPTIFVGIFVFLYAALIIR
jgi:hypothetical protein